MLLRGVFVLVTLQFVLNFWQSSANSQTTGDIDRVISWIKQNGGEFIRDESRVGNPIVYLRLARGGGINLGFQSQALQDEDLKQLTVLTELEHLDLKDCTTLSDKSLLYLTSLKSLRSLNLSRTSINGVGLNYLAALGQLKELNLSGCHWLNDMTSGHLKRLQQLTSICLDAPSDQPFEDWMWRNELMQRATSSASTSYFGHQLEELRGGISDDGLRQILGLHNLQELSIQRTKITDAGARELTHLARLESLDISRTAITDAALESICQLKQLRKLKLNFVAISDAGLRNLTKLERLEEIELRGTPIGTIGIQALVALPRLRRLDLNMTQVTEDVLEELSAMPRLDELALSPLSFSFHGLVRFADRHPNFDLQKVLRLSGTATTNAVGAIDSLSLSGQPIDDSDLYLLQGFDQLRVLQLGETHITDRGLLHLRKLTKLKFLSIKGTTVSFKGLHDLFVNEQGRTLGEMFDVVGVRRNAYQPSEEEGDFIDLRYLPINDSDLPVLAEYQSATSLFLGGHQITDDGLRHVARLKNLRRLWLSGPEFTGVSLSNLGPNSIRELFLTDTSVSENDLGFLGKNFPSLRVVNLSGTLKSDIGVEHLLGLRDLRVLIVDAFVLSRSAIESLRVAKPNLLIIESQIQAMREIRGKQRTDDPMPQGGSRVSEMANVLSTIPEHPLIQIYGDAYFEIADTLSFQDKLSATSRWAHLSSVHTVDLISISDLKDAPACLKDLPLLRDVNFYRSNICDVDLVAVGSLSKLESLGLQRTPITNMGLFHIRGLKSLKKLSLGGHGSQIGDEGMKWLAGLTDLEQLEIDGTSITDASLVHLRELKKLKSISMRGVRVDEGLRNISDLKELENIDLYSTFLSDETVRSFSSFPNLKRLSVRDTMLSEEGIKLLHACAPGAEIDSSQLMTAQTRQAVEPLARLRATLYRDSAAEVYLIDFSDVNDATEALPCIFQLGNSLTDLNLGKHATNQLLADLKQLPKLSALYLSGSQISSEGLIHLRGLPQLRAFGLQHGIVDGAGLASVVELQNLEILGLYGCTLPSDAYAKIGNMPRIQELYLSKTSITDSDLTHLSKLQNLRRLYLDDTGVTIAGLIQLKTLGQLETLSLVGTQLTENDVRQLQEALPKCELVL